MSSMVTEPASTGFGESVMVTAMSAFCRHRHRDPPHSGDEQVVHLRQHPTRTFEVDETLFGSTVPADLWLGRMARPARPWIASTFDSTSRTRARLRDTTRSRCGKRAEYERKSPQRSR